MVFFYLYYHNKQSPSITIIFSELLSMKTRDIISNILGYMNIILLFPMLSKFFFLFGVTYCVPISYISITHYITLQRRKSQKVESHNLQRDRVDVRKSYFILLLLLLNNRISIKSTSSLSVAAHKHF